MTHDEKLEGSSILNLRSMVQKFWQFRKLISYKTPDTLGSLIHVHTAFAILSLTIRSAFFGLEKEIDVFLATLNY